MPIVDSTNQYKIVHDHNLPLCFVGNSHYNEVLHEYFDGTRHCVLKTLEEVQEMTTLERDRYQYICLTTRPAFKHQVKTVFDDLGLNSFSVVANMASIGANVNIGYNVMVDQFSYIWDDCSIGDFTTLACHTTVAHGSSIGAYCHIAPYAHVAYATLLDGVFVGNGSFVYATRDSRLTIANWCNLQAYSKVFESIYTSGTYYCTRLVDRRNSLSLSL